MTDDEITETRRALRLAIANAIENKSRAVDLRRVLMTLPNISNTLKNLIIDKVINSEMFEVGTEAAHIARLTAERQARKQDALEQYEIIETKIEENIPLSSEEQLALHNKQEAEAKEQKEVILKEIKNKKQVQAEINNKLMWKNQILSDRMREAYDISYDVPEDFLNRTKRSLNLWGIHTPGECAMDESSIREHEYDIFYIPKIGAKSQFYYNPFKSDLQMRTITDTAYPRTRDLNLEQSHLPKECLI